LYSSGLLKSIFTSTRKTLPSDYIFTEFNVVITEVGILLIFLTTLLKYPKFYCGFFSCVYEFKYSISLQINYIFAVNKNYPYFCIWVCFLTKLPDRPWDPPTNGHYGLLLRRVVKPTAPIYVLLTLKIRRYVPTLLHGAELNYTQRTWAIWSCLNIQYQFGYLKKFLLVNVVTQIFNIKYNSCQKLKGNELL
jgi:hypothetical protein